MPKPFLVIPCTDAESSAVFWHGNRYLISEVLCQHFQEDEDGTQAFVFETEADATELREALEAEDNRLPCLDENTELAHTLFTMEFV